MGGKPAGTVTFLFTDVEGSTRLWEAYRASMEAALSRHDAILREVFTGHGGYVFATAGDAFCVAFDPASDAVLAAVDAQRRLAAEPWPEDASLRVRMGIHVGEAQERDGDYFGPAVNRAARLMAVGRGGQILVSLAVHELLSGSDLEEIDFVALGPHRLRDLQAPESIWQVAAQGIEQRFGPLRTLDRAPGNLPITTSSFLARDAELSKLRGELSRSRIVTLIGVGGVGKTRLALQTAADSVDDFPDGVWFCDLAPVSDMAAVPFTLAAALELPERAHGQVLVAITEALAQRKALLLVDNCEHVIDAAATLVEAIGQHCPHVTILATSREALAVEGEAIMPLKPLDPTGAGALDLFVERAVAAGADLPESAFPPIREICVRLDGIPLALELAASRLRSMSAHELAANLDQRFQLLGGSRRHAPGRHQTLKQTVDWSYALLDSGDQSLFNQLAVFAGGFDAEAAAAVTGLTSMATRQGLARLVERSLLEATTTGPTTRYRQLETLRQYAHDRLLETGQLEEAMNAHASHYLELARRVRHGIRSPDEALWVERVDVELANFRAAHSWAVACNNADVALGILAGLWDDVQHRRRFELGEWVSDAVKLPAAADHALRPVALALQALVSQMQGLQDLAAAQSELAIAEEERLSLPTFIYCRIIRVSAAAYQGDIPEGEALWDRHRAIITAAAEPYDEVWVGVFDNFMQMGTDPAGAVDRARLLIAAAERLGVPTLMAWGLYARGVVMRTVDPSRAVADLDEAVRLASSVRASYCADGAAAAAVSAFALQGHTDQRATLQRFKALLQRQLDAGDQLRIPTTLRQLGLNLAECGRLAEAAVLFAAETTFPSAPLFATADPERHLVALQRITELLDPAVAERCATRGRAMTIIDAARYAISVVEDSLRGPAIEA